MSYGFLNTGEDRYRKAASVGNTRSSEQSRNLHLRFVETARRSGFSIWAS